jgi:hypothetical protein
MTTHTRLRRFAFLALALALGALVYVIAFTQASTASTPQDTVAHAWDLAQASGAYRFQTAIDQRTSAMPSLRNAGRLPRHDYVSLRGRIDQPAEQLDLLLWRANTPQPKDALELRIADGQALGRVAGGDWAQVDLDTTSFAPGGDPLGFLAAVHTVQAGPVETRELDATILTYRTYTFGLDGAAFARYLEQRVVPKLRERGQLPSWARLDLAAQYEEMRGNGTLWLDADGLPARLKLDLQLPTPKGASAAHATLTSDFFDFDRDQLALASTRLLDNPAGWARYRLELLGAAAPTLRPLAVRLLAALLVLALVALCLPLLRSRSFYRSIVLLVLLSLTLTPLLQAHEVAAFADSQQAKQARQETDLARVNAREDLAAARRQPTMDAHTAPVRAEQPDLSAAQAALAPQSAVASAPAQSSNDTTDSDGDGLADADELDWGSCPSRSSTSANCTNVADPTDSDGDGLLDGTEINSLTTLPASWDSDNDTLTDTLEINGFRYNNKTWYLNPNEADSNSDDLLDSVECQVWVSSSPSFNPTATCPDTDKDGTPDVWDDDNDGDGVIDALDLDSSASSTTYSAATPLELTVSSLTPNQPVFVDVQLRPTSTTHLNYISTILDWPSGDTSGQIQRRLNTTFANTANAELQSDDANAANGDIRLVPMLEITIPYQAGHYGNLPVKAAYQNTPRSIGVAVDSWLDSDKLDPYGITVRDADTTSGDLLIYLPLTSVEDTISGERLAFSARMLYWPNGSTNTSGGVVAWGNAQEYRVIWMVQMLTDECIEANADTDTCARQDTLQVIHSYDETWKLTGLAVREDLGLETTILYEDPNQDDDLSEEDDLWAASWNLNNIWLRARDCEIMVGSACQGNGSRDVTVATMEATLDAYSAGQDAIEARRNSYDHQGYLSQIMGTEVPGLLDTVFTGRTSETTLLVAREETYRTAGLSDATVSGYSLSIAMSAADAPQIVQAVMSWSRYIYDGASGWSNYDSEEDIERLALDLAQQSFFQAADSSEESQYEAQGKIISAQTYYSAMINGLSSMVELDGALTWEASSANDGIPEQDYRSAWPANNFTGAAFTAFAVKDMLVNALGAIKFSAESAFWSTLGKSFKNPQVTAQFDKTLKSARYGSNVLMGASIIATATGLALFAAGYLEGDSALLSAGIYVLSAATIVISVVWTANIVYGMYKTSGALMSVMRLDKLAGVASANRMIGGIGLVIAIGVTWGLFIYSALSAGLFKRTGSIAFNTLLAYTIASTIVVLILFILDLIPIAGPIIVALIYIIDTILALACDCDGFQTWLTGVIAETLYDIDYVITNFDSSDRLDFDIASISYSDPDGGFTTANGVIYGVDVTSTLHYGSDNSDSQARQSVLRYALQRYKTDQHANLSLDAMRDDWANIGDRNLRTTTSVQYGPIAFSSLGTGINRSLNGRLYLTESYVLPYRGCWLAFGFRAKCNNWESLKGSSHLNVGQYQLFDILPADLDTFVGLGWNSHATLKFASSLDADGDGLTSAIDPNSSSWDGDGDGASDYYELTYGTNPKLADTDGDGLDDEQELRRDLDPLDADADDDTLSDSVEWAGWSYTYSTGRGTRATTWVWPSPYLADADGDSLDDAIEQQYGYHPWIANDDDDVIDTVALGQGTIVERNAATALLRFEERNDAQSFTDESGQDHVASCDQNAGGCPAAGESGRFGNGLVFDGNDLLTLDAESDFDLNRMTIAAWIKVDAFTRDWQTILAKGDSWGLRRYANTSYVSVFAKGMSDDGLYWTIPIDDGKWHHVVGSFDGTMLNLYLDGSLIRGYSFYGGAVTANDAPVTIGGSATEAGRGFEGSLDEVVIYDHATSASDLVSGKYRSSDNVVAPSETIDTSLTITNTNVSRAAAVTYYGELDDDFSGVSRVTPFTHETYEGNVPGYLNNAIQLDGDDYVGFGSNMNPTRFTKAYAVGAWFYPLGGGTFRHQRAITLQAQNTSNSALHDAVYYDRDSQRFWSTYTTSIGDVGAPLNQWHHVMLVYDRQSQAQFLYVDGVLAARGVVPQAKFYSEVKYQRVGDQITSGDLFDNQVHGFIGKVDELKVFNDYVLGAAEVQQIMQGQTPTRAIEPATSVFSIPASSKSTIGSSFTIPSGTPSGSFNYSQVAEASLDVTDTLSVKTQPVVLAHFDEPRSSTTRPIAPLYSSLSPFYQNSDCYISTCPTLTSGIAGQALEFNGNNVVEVPAPLTAAPWSIGLHLYPTDTGYRSIFGNYATTYGFPILLLKGDKTLSLAVYSSSTGWREFSPSGASALTLSRWQHVAVTFDGTSTYTLYLDGQLYGTVTATPSNRTTPIRLGYAPGYYTFGGPRAFKGKIDNFVVYNTKLGADEVLALSSINDLALHAHYTFDEPPGKSVVTDMAGIFGDAACSGAACPVFGRHGQVNHAAVFDGSDSLASANKPEYWRITDADYSVAGWVKAQNGKLVEAKGLRQPLQLWTDALYGGYAGNGAASGTAWYSASVATLPSPPDEWLHIVAVHDNNNYDAIYLNGTRVITTSWQTANSVTGANALTIAEKLVGALDDLRVYNRAMSDADVSSLYATSRPLLQYEFEEGKGATTFADASSYGHDASSLGVEAGNGGRVGYAATFNGSGSLVVPNTTTADSLAGNLSIMAWVRPSQLASAQTLFASASNATGKGMFLSLASGFLKFGNASNSVLSTRAVASDEWTHVAVVFDQNSKATFYIDGSVAGIRSLVAPISADSDGIVTIGARSANGGASYSDYFSGKLDELSVYARALSAIEIKAAFNQQFFWYRNVYTTRITVDSEAPTITLLDAQSYWLNDQIQFTVSTTDTTTAVRTLDFSIANASNTVVLKNQPVTRCADGVANTLWCLLVDPASFGGSGAYILTLQAVDAAGNVATRTYPLSIDGNAPTLGPSYADTVVAVTTDPTDDRTWNVSLSGTISDPRLSTAVAGSGINTETVLVSLIDTTGAVVAGGPYLATISGSTWSVDYAVTDDRPVGRYTVRMAAADQIGNSVTQDLGTVLLDGRAPAVKFNSSTVSRDILGPMTLSGIVSEPPAPAGEVASFHFTENDSASSFAGTTDGSIVAACIGGCPWRTVGAFGDGRYFNAERALTVPATDTLDIDVGTLSAWLKPEWTAGAPTSDPTIMALSDGSSTRFRWSLDKSYQYLSLDNGTSTLTIPVTLAPNSWAHLALVQSGSEWTVYVDGVQVGSVEQPFGTATGLPLTIGSSAGGANFFSGTLDEVQIFDRVLQASEIYALAQDEVAGVSSVEIGIQPFDYDSPPLDDSAVGWSAANLNLSNNSQTSWSYGLPGTLEGFYEVSLRSTDRRSNRLNKGVIYRGPIDTRGPRVSYTSEFSGGMLTGVRSYSMTVEDMFIDESALEHPCIGQSTAKVEYLSYYDNPPLPTSLRISCEIPGVVYGAYRINVPDFAGNSFFSWAPRTYPTNMTEVAIYTPTLATVVTGTNPITISGAAYAQLQLAELSLSVDGVPIPASTYPTNSLSATWDASWTPPNPGVYTIVATLRDSVGTIYTDTVDVTVRNNLAPAGVGDDLALWLRADAGLGVTSDGGLVASWVDQKQGWVAANTTDTSPTLALDAINYHPALRFSAGGTSELSFGANFVAAEAGSTGLSVFVVADPSAATGSGQLLLDTGSYPNAGYGLAYSADTVQGYAPAADSSGAGQSLQAEPASHAPALLSYALAFGTGSTLAVNGTPLASNSIAALSQITSANISHGAAHTASSGPLTIGRQAQDSAAAGRSFRGDIAEVIIYRSALSVAQRQQIESYLALKYGLTLTSTSYVDSGGTVLWDAASQGEFTNRVAAIGADRATALDQRRAASVNGGGITLVLGSSPTTTAGFETDRSFLLVGDDNGSLADTTAVMSGTLAYDRLLRTWQARETGSVGAVQIVLDTGVLSDTSPLPVLLVSAERAFSSPRVITGSLVDGAAVYGVDLADGEYFSFGLNPSDLITIGRASNGAGSVASSPAGVSCDGSCALRLDYPAVYTLTATPATGSSFSGWNGACSGSATCTITVGVSAPVTASFTLNTYALNVSRSGTGSGLLSSSGGEISCGVDCGEILNYGTVVTLTATPRYGSAFEGWGGVCSGTGECVVTIDAAKAVTASFSNPNGAPYGDNAWPIPGIIQAEDYNIGGEGVAYHDSDTRNRGFYRGDEAVDALANQDSDKSPVVAWTAVGEWLRYTVEVSETGYYGVDVRAANVGAGASLYVEVDGVRQVPQLAIGNTGDYYVYTTTATSGISLTAGLHVLTIGFAPKPGQSGTGNINWLRFVRQELVSVARDGTGVGTVSSGPTGISCGADCAESYDLGTTVTLTATPATGSSFSGWSGDCSGTESCSVTADRARGVTATFTLNAYPLTVTVLGDGAGTVSSSGGEISCGSDCAENLAYGSVVTLSASATSGTFTGWGGACSGMGECVVTIDELNEVTTTFRNAYTLRVGKGGSGSGTITGGLEGIFCGDDCTELIDVGTTITLTATPDAHSNFAGWEGACSGTGDCVIGVESVEEVTAIFALKQFELSVRIASGGQGSVSSSPVGIDCGNGGMGGDDCGEPFEYGSVVQLSVNVGPHQVFGGWSGACSGTGDCIVTVQEATEVVADVYECMAFTVINGDDDGPGSLRQAVARACSGAVITFDGDHTIGLTSDRLAINTDLTIDGGQHNITIDASGVGLNYFNGGVMAIGGHSVVLNHLTLTGGTAWAGGGIYNNGTLTIENSTIHGNQAFGYSQPGGGIYNTGTLTLTSSSIRNNGTASAGAGIYSTANTTLTISDTLIEQNSASLDGGGLLLAENTIAAIENSTFARNSGRDGGGIASFGALTIRGSSFISNSANTQVIDIFQSYGGNGGGLRVFAGGSVAISDSSFSQNKADAYGGGVSIENGSLSTIEGSAFSNNTASHGAGVTASGTQLTIRATTFEQNSADGFAGGLYAQNGSVTVSDSEFTGNTGILGGAAAESDATLDVNDTSFVNNTSQMWGGALYGCFGNLTLNRSSLLSNVADTSKNGYGGAIFFHCGGTLTVNDSELLENQASYGGALSIWDGNVAINSSTLAGNTAEGGMLDNPDACHEDCDIRDENGNVIGYCATDCAPPPEPDSRGGAIYSSGDLSINNSTLSNNSADIGGGGVYAEYGSAAISGSTIAGNGAGEGGGLLNFWGELHVVNTIIADSSSGGDCVSPGGLDSNIATLVEDGGCDAALSDDPLLAPLGNYGGSTQTHMLLHGSPALDAGDSAACLATDQRGNARPVGAACDIGAYEREDSPPQYQLTVNVSGGGSISSSPAGIDCGSDCSELLDYGATVVLTANPADGMIFTGWSGACSGTGSCTLTMHGVKRITATFRAPTATSTPSPTPSSTATPSSTPSSTATPSPTPSSTATPSPTPSSTATPTGTPTETATPTGTPTETATPTSTPAASATATSTSSATNTPLASPTTTATSTSTVRATAINSPTATATTTNATTTATNAASTIATATSTLTNTATPTNAATNVLTPTNTPTHTLAPTDVPTSTPTSGQPGRRRLYLPLILTVSQPDSMVSLQMSPDKSALASGEAVKIQAMVINQGDAPVRGFWVDLYLNPSALLRGPISCGTRAAECSRVMALTGSIQRG